jgi:hypothetical protein
MLHNKRRNKHTQKNKKLGEYIVIWLDDDVLFGCGVGQFSLRCRWHTGGWFLSVWRGDIRR